MNHQKIIIFTVCFLFMCATVTGFTVLFRKYKALEKTISANSGDIQQVGAYLNASIQLGVFPSVLQLQQAVQNQQTAASTTTRP